MPYKSDHSCIFDNYSCENALICHSWVSFQLFDFCRKIHNLQNKVCQSAFLKTSVNLAWLAFFAIKKKCRNLRSNYFPFFKANLAVFILENAPLSKIKKNPLDWGLNFLCGPLKNKCFFGYFYSNRCFSQIF